MRLLLAAIALCVASPTIAQQPPQLTLGATEPYRHKPSGLSVPTTLDGLQRTSAVAYVPDLDEALSFDNPSNSDTLTVYVFRNVSGSVPLWFDRIDWVASHRDIYGGLVPLHTPTAFTPPGQGTASGLIDSYSVSKGPYRSTAIAFMPLGADWYVSVRYSSKTLDGATLERISARSSRRSAGRRRSRHSPPPCRSQIVRPRSRCRATRNRSTVARRWAVRCCSVPCCRAHRPTRSRRWRRMNLRHRP